MNRRRIWRLHAATGTALAVILAACGGGGSDVSGDGDPGDCIVVDMAVSSEKITLLTELAAEFNASDDAEVDGECVFVRPARKASGAAADLIVAGWPDPESNGPAPVIWSPAASGWAGIVNERAGATVAPAGTPFMLTPLVIAMPQPMAEALGWPDAEIGFADIVALAKDDAGWASFGHPEWGPFRLGKTNPNFSTSGLNVTIAQYYAATGKRENLTVEDLNRAEVQQFSRDVESAVVHYGDITMTFLNNWFAADARGTSLTYASAVAIEEKSLIDYNRGDPDGELAPGEVPREPRVPLVGIYPSEGTLYSDNPFIILDADWVTPEQRQAAELFETFVQLPENQEKVLEFGFRPNNPAVPLAAPVSPEFGVDPREPRAELEVPEPQVLVRILDAWAEQRKEARVLLVLDVSGSMGEPATSDGRTRLDLAQEAAVSALDQFKDADEVGLWVFSTDQDVLGAPDPNYRELVPVAPIGDRRDLMAGEIMAQIPTNGTPLYDVTGKAYETMLQGYDPEKINAVVFLTDGINDDGVFEDDEQEFSTLLATLQRGSEGASSRPVRVFTISYSDAADTATLRAIAQATSAAHYDASNPATIQQVFTNVISNF